MTTIDLTTESVALDIGAAEIVVDVTEVESVIAVAEDAVDVTVTEEVVAVTVTEGDSITVDVVEEAVTVEVTEDGGGDYVLTKAKVEAVLTGDITTHTHPGGSVIRYFADATARDAYYSAHPSELQDAILTTLDSAAGDVIGGTYLLQTQTGNATLTDGDLNTIHVCTSAAQLTLPTITTAMIGKWARIKKDTTGTVAFVANGGDTIEGGANITNATTNLADFIDVVAEGLGDWGVHESFGTWGTV